MKKERYIYTVLICAMLMGTFTIKAQDQELKIHYAEMSLDEMRQLTQDDLLQIPFEDLIAMVKRFKVSSIDELYQLILNPSQSTASKMEEDVFESTLATTVITANELVNSGVRNIPEALRLAPGVIVREKTNGNYDVHIRGNDYLPPGSDISNSVNSTTLVMIDNRPVYNRYLGATFWETLPVSVNDLEKIEIIYGPSSALYGPNAVSGVIHLITKKADEEGLHTSADVQAGNNNSVIGYGDVSYVKGKLGVNLSANYRQMDRFQDTYYIPQNDTYVSGSEVGDINAGFNDTFTADAFNDDYQKALNSGGVNLGLQYQFSDRTNLSYMGSYQNSSAQTAYMDLGSVLSTRESNSFAQSLAFKSGGFEAQFSGITGHLNAIKGMAGYEYDYTELNGKLGWNFKYKNLSIRPGVEAEYAKYSDEDYVNVEFNEGLLNGTVDLGSLQGSLRLDYTAWDKLRLTGALMHGYFYATEDNYTSYQFSTSYKANESTLLRLVASKANSSPFVLNTYMDKTIGSEEVTELESNQTSMIMIKKGNKNLSPLEMNMFEFGLRKKWGKKLQADFTVFYNQSDNFSQMTKNTSDATETIEIKEEDQSVGDAMAETVQNINLEAMQLGLTTSLKYVFNEKINASVFATYQKTSLDNYEVSEDSYYESLTGNSGDDLTLSENSVYISLDHDYTPKFYGGGYINYKPGKKWNLNASFYAYSKQKTFYAVGQNFKWIEIDPKLTCNLKASYQVNKWLNTYVNLRNFTNRTSKEFMFTDDTGVSCLAGCKINF